MRRLLAAAFLLASVVAAQAQGCGPTNPNCIVPTAPPGTSNNQAASTEFVQSAAGLGSRTRLTMPLDLYSDFVGGNDSNTCLSTLVACKTVQAAYNKIVLNYDTGGQNITIHVAANDNTCLALNVPWVGGGQVVVAGPGANTVQPTVGFVGCASYGVLVNTTLPNNLFLTNLAVSSAGNNSSVQHSGIGQVILSNVAFGSAGFSHVFAVGPGAQISCAQPTILTMTAGIPTGFWAATSAGGALFCPNAKMVFIGTQTYGTTAFATSAGILLLTSTSFCSAYSQTTCTAVSAVSGARFNSSQNGVIDTGTANISAIPGSTPGVLTNGGVYN